MVHNGWMPISVHRLLVHEKDVIKNTVRTAFSGSATKRPINISRDFVGISHGNVQEWKHWKIFSIDFERTRILSFPACDREREMTDERDPCHRKMLVPPPRSTWTGRRFINWKNSFNIVVRFWLIERLIYSLNVNISRIFGCFLKFCTNFRSI